MAVAIASTVAACGNTLSSNAPEGAKAGTWDGECEAGFLNRCSNEGARHKLKPEEVWCLWKGRDVVVHVKLKSEFVAKLKVSVIPRYVIKDGGQHGTAFASEVGTTIGSRGTRVLDINAGHPKGVPSNADISECKPKLYDVDVAD